MTPPPCPSPRRGSAVETEPAAQHLGVDPGLNNRSVGEYGLSMGAPNILMVMADQLAPHFTSTYGHEVVKTPNLEALAERGARFDNAYCHSPLCAPARFTMLSGQPVSAIGAWAVSYTHLTLPTICSV